MGKSKRSHSPAISRRIRSKKTTQDVHMNIVINKQQETTILQTIKTLHAREYKKNVDRDAEFVKFVQQLYRSCQSRLRPIYQGAQQSLLKKCADQARNFQGVNKRAKEDDAANLLKSIRFDLDEGKSWADQRRAKWIVPLCVGWLDAIEKEVTQLSSELDLPERFLVNSVVKLLTTSYHPPARQSTTTNLICTQTMNHKDFRKRLTELTGIELPRPKELISRWLSDVRENGLAARSSPGTAFSTSTSAEDDTIRRELAIRNASLEHELAATKEMLRKCQSDLVACRQERDQLWNQLERKQSCCTHMVAPPDEWPNHRTDGFSVDDPSQPMPMPAAMPVHPTIPPSTSYHPCFDFDSMNSSQGFNIQYSADTGYAWSPGGQTYYY